MDPARPRRVGSRHGRRAAEHPRLPGGTERNGNGSSPGDTNLSATILVVDDSPTVVQLATRPLEAEGYRVITAGDGEQALRTARQERPDLIVLDIILPKINGFQVCRQIKSDPKTQRIKILLISSKTNESDRFWGLRQGADSYMTKPFESHELLRNVAQLLNSGNVPAGS